MKIFTAGNSLCMAVVLCGAWQPQTYLYAALVVSALRLVCHHDSVAYLLRTLILLLASCPQCKTQIG